MTVSEISVIRLANMHRRNDSDNNTLSRRDLYFRRFA